VKYLKKINEKLEKKIWSVTEVVIDNGIVDMIYTSLFENKEDMENFIINYANEIKGQLTEITTDNVIFDYDEAIKYLDRESDTKFYISEADFIRDIQIDPLVKQKQDANKFGL